MTVTKGITSPSLGTLNWDVPLNANFAAIEKAFGTAVNVTATSGSYVLTTSDLGNMALRCVGALTADVTLQVPLLTAGQWVVINNTTDASGGPWSLYMVSAGGGTPLKIERGTTRSVYSDGTAGGVVFADTPFTAGSTTQIIYNNAGTLTGSPNLTTDGTSLYTGGLNASVQTRSPVYLDAAGGNTATINGITPVDTASVLATFHAVGAAPVYACRAWARLGQPNLIFGAGNIASIVRNSIGNFTINFAVAMPDTNYAVVITASGAGSTPQSSALTYWSTNYAVGSFQLFASDNNTDALVDPPYINIAVFR